MAEAAEKILLDIKIDYASLAKQLDDTGKKIADLNAKQKELNTSLELAKKSGNTAEIEANTAALFKNKAETKALQQEQKNLEVQGKTLAQAASAEKGSYEELFRIQKLREIQLKTLGGQLQVNSKGELELTAEYKKQSSEVLKGKEALLQFNAGIKDGRLNVGNYADGFEKAIEKTGLFRGSLGDLKGILEQSKAGYEAVKQGASLVVEGFENAGKATKAFVVNVGESVGIINNFSSTNGDLSGNITQTATSLGDAANEAENLGTAGKAAGTALETGGKAGAGAMNLLKIGIAATGIGLLLIAAGALFAFFKKNEEAAELLERVFAGLGAVVDVLVDGFVNIGKAIFNFRDTMTKVGDFIKNQLINRFTGLLDVLTGIATLDFTKAGEGLIKLNTGFTSDQIKEGAKAIGDYKDKLVEAAREASVLKSREQELEDTIRNQSIAYNNQKNRITEIQRLLKDKNITEKERIALGKEAIAIQENLSRIDLANAAEAKAIAVDKLLIGKEISKDEKARLAELLKLSRERTASENEQLSVLQNSANIRDFELDSVIETTNKVNDTVAQGNETRIRLEKEVKSAVLAEQKKYITALAGILDDELKLKELQGVKDFDGQRKIAVKLRDAALLEAELTATEKQKIEKDLQVRLAEIDKEQTDFKIQLQEQAQDALLNRMADGKEKEIAIESLNIQRKLDAIKGNSAEELALREALIAESAAKIAEIEAKYTREVINSDADLQLQQQKDIYNEEVNALKIARSQQLITEQVFQSKMQELRVKSLKDQLTIQLNEQAQLQLQDQQKYDAEIDRLIKAFENKEITQAQFNEGVSAAQLQFYAAQAETEVSTQSGITESINAIKQSQVDFQVTTNQQLLDNEQRLSDERYAIQQASLSFAGTIVSGFKDLLGQDEQNKKKYAKLIKALAIGEVQINLLAELSAIAKAAAANPLNGPTAGGAGITQYLIQSGAAVARSVFATAKITAQEFADGGITVQGAQRRYNAKPIGSFASGGNVRSASLGLIGEAGPEFVVNNPTLNHPYYSPMVESMEHFRRTGQVMPVYADGGFTESRISLPVQQGNQSAELLAAVKETKTVLVVEQLDAVKGKMVEAQELLKV